MRFLDRSVFLATASGSGTFTVGSAVTGYQTPAQAGVVDGSAYRYHAQSSDLTQWEYGFGTYSASGATLTRTVLGNSLNTTSAINFTNPPQVSITFLAEDIPPSSIIVDKGTVNSGTVTFDVSAAAVQKLTVGGALTVAFSSWPASGTYGENVIHLVNGGVGVTWPTVNWFKGDGTSSTIFANMGVVLQNPGTNFVTVWSDDGGTTLYGRAA